MKPSAPPITPTNMDTAADKHGHTLDAVPAADKRLLELQVELEKTEGPRRVEVQKEIDRLQKRAT